MSPRTEYVHAGHVTCTARLIVVFNIDSIVLHAKVCSRFCYSTAFKSPDSLHTWPSTSVQLAASTPCLHKRATRCTILPGTSCCRILERATLQLPGWHVLVLNSS
jgi:hypothetical protein